MILLPRSDGGAPFWANVDDALDALTNTPITTPTIRVPRILTDADRQAGTVEQRIGVPRADVKEVSDRFSADLARARERHEKRVADERARRETVPTPAAPPVASSSKTPLPAPAAPPVASSSKTPLLIAAGVGVALVALVMLRR